MHGTRGVALVALLSVATLSLAWAVQPGPSDRQPAPQEKETPPLPQFCQEIKKLVDAAAAKQKDADIRLTSLVTSMNEATGGAKVDAMAAVVNELITQRNAARARDMGLESAIREHIMQHLIASAPDERSEKLKKDLEGCILVHPAGETSR